MRVRHIGTAVAAGLFSLAALAVPAGAQAPGALRVCTTGDYAPYSVTDHGGYRGIDIDLAQGLGDVLYRQVDFVPTSWSSMKTDFAAKNCDLAVGGISDSPARRAFADFSMGYGTDGKAPISRKSDGDKYATIEQINRPGVRVVVNPGGTNEEFAHKNFPQAQLVPWPDNKTILD